MPLVLAPDKTKMSKRKGAVPVIDYLERGYLPEALLNAICLCGWNPGTEQELFTRSELEQVFDLDKVQKGGAVFNEEKLNWFNREYIKRLSLADQIAWIQKYLPEKFFPIIDKLRPVIIERIVSFGEIADLAKAGEFDYYINRPHIPKECVAWKGDDIATAQKHLAHVIQILESIDESSWTMESIKSALWPYAESAGKGSVLWPMRFALSGRDKSPDPFVLAGILGKTETLQRLTLVCKNLL
jgi:glutamyl-tRNA synthetase